MRGWLKKLRLESHNLTQEQLAKMVGISRTMITEIENGNANPSVEVAKKIAAVLGLNGHVFMRTRRPRPTAQRRRWQRIKQTKKAPSDEGA